MKKKEKVQTFVRDSCCFVTDDEIIYLEQPNKPTEKLLKLIGFLDWRLSFGPSLSTKLNVLALRITHAKLFSVA